MSYFHTCEYCGGNLDPGEKCDCRERKFQIPQNAKKMEYPKERRKHAGRAVCI